MIRRFLGRTTKSARTVPNASKARLGFDGCVRNAANEREGDWAGHFVRLACHDYGLDSALSSDAGRVLLLGFLNRLRREIATSSLHTRTTAIHFYRQPMVRTIVFHVSQRER